ncbi:MAG: YXWGXW repeat-containing protein [Candidatus Rokubacteria bacterium]|nr:YXWGXW repeat-containing protein [Candidatus Rokubacteria bacterium]
MMKKASAFLTGSVMVAAMLVLVPAGAWAGSFRFGASPLRLGGLAGPPNAGVQRPAGTTKTVTQTVVIITNPQARPVDHLPFLHPFPQTVEVPPSMVVIQSSVTVTGSNGHATPSAWQWVWQPGRWVWGEHGWAWWPGQWVWVK